MMRDLKKVLATPLLLGLLAASAFAFDDQKDRRPPKEPKVVVQEPKKDPPRNNDDGGSRGREGNRNEQRENRDRKGGRP